MKFKYKNKLYVPKNPEKKLKQLGITWDDVEIIPEKQKAEEQAEILNSPKLYYFKHPNENIIHASTINNIKEHFKENPKYYWDEETKTGLGRKWTWEYINRLERYDFNGND